MLDVDFGSSSSSNSRCYLSSAVRSRQLDTYSPAAIDIAPATKIRHPSDQDIVPGCLAAATPTIRLAAETMPLLTPSTAALNHPDAVYEMPFLEPARCGSLRNFRQACFRNVKGLPKQRCDP